MFRKAALCALFFAGILQAQEVKLLLDWWPNANHIPLYVGMEKGYFQEEGIQLTILKSPEPVRAVPFLRSGSADVVLYYMPQALLAQSLKNDFDLIGTLSNCPLQAFLYLDESPIQRPADLNNLTLGGHFSGLQGALLDQFAHQHKISFKRKNVGFDLSLALLTKAVDVAMGIFWNIQPEQLASRGIKTRYFKIEDLGMPFYQELVFLAKKDFSKVQAFQRALQKSIDQARANPDEAFTIYARFQPDKSPQVLKWQRSSWEKTLPLLPKTQIFDPLMLENLRKWLQDRNSFLGKN